MPRANRYYVPGQIWHITHRCHKKEFLLKFKRDRECWLSWLFEAKKRFNLTVLNYMVTSNHIHLLVQDGENREVSKSMQLIAGCTAQAFNKRKARNGAYWEDRYHATAIDTQKYLIRCLLYIDLNMVRAGVVKHPSEWKHSGYNEIQNPPERYRIIDREKLKQLVGLASNEDLTKAHFSWTDSALQREEYCREAMWTECLAVGRQVFAELFLDSLGATGLYRQIEERFDIHVVKEDKTTYTVDF